MNLIILLFLTALIAGSKYLVHYLNLPTDPNPSIILGLILVSAWVVGRAVKNKTFPMLTGFILYGILIGPRGLNLMTPVDIQSLEFIRFLVLMLIAFLAGGRLELKSHSGFSKMIPLLILTQFLVVLTGTGIVFWIVSAFFPGNPFLQNPLFSVLIIALILASGSPAVVLSVNRENVSPVRIKALILNATILLSIPLILLFLGKGVLLHAMMAEGPSWSRALQTFAIHFFSVLLIALCMGFLLRVILNRFRGELIFFLIVFIIILFGGGDLYLPELMLSFMGAGIIVRYKSVTGKRFIKDITKYSLPFYAVFFTLTIAGMKLSLIPKLLPVVFLLFILRYLFLRIATEGFLRLWKEETGDARAISKAFMSQSGLTLSFISILCSFTGISYRDELCTVLTLLVFLNLLIGPPLLQRALYRIKTFRES